MYYASINHYLYIDECEEIQSKFQKLHWMVLSMDQLWINEDVKIAPGRSTDSGDASWDNRWIEKVVRQSTIGGVAGEPEK